MNIDFDKINFSIRGFKKREPILFEKIKKVFPEISKINDKNNIPKLPSVCTGLALDYLYNIINNPIPNCFYDNIEIEHSDNVNLLIYTNRDNTITLSLENDDCFVCLDLGYYTVSCNFKIKIEDIALKLVTLILAINKAKEVKRNINE